MFPTRTPADHAEVRAAITANLHEPGRMDALRAMLGQNLVRTLVVMGTKDPDFFDPVEEARHLAGQLKAKTVIVDGAGHYPHTEMPELVAPRLLAFLARLQHKGTGERPASQI